MTIPTHYSAVSMIDSKMAKMSFSHNCCLFLSSPQLITLSFVGETNGMDINLPISQGPEDGRVMPLESVVNILDKFNPAFRATVSEVIGL